MFDAHQFFDKKNLSARGLEYYDLRTHVVGAFFKGMIPNSTS